MDIRPPAPSRSPSLPGSKHPLRAMTDNARLQDLQRRVQKDPASIAFAQLAEEYRRAARFQDAIETCRAGLALHPAYVSARVTLGRALVELAQLTEANRALEQGPPRGPET